LSKPQKEESGFLISIGHNFFIHLHILTMSYTLNTHIHTSPGQEQVNDIHTLTQNHGLSQQQHLTTGKTFDSYALLLQ